MSVLESEAKAFFAAWIISPAITQSKLIAECSWSKGQNIVVETKQLFESAEDIGPKTHSTGVFPSQAIEQLIAAGGIYSEEPISSCQVQPSSIDLRLGPVAFRVLAGFLPGSRSTVKQKLTSQGHNVVELDLEASQLLEKGCVYIVPLMETLNLPKDVSAKANPKSTTGRLDIFTRLITDFGDRFDRVPPGYKGRLFAEISPRSFSIRVRKGDMLGQLRFLRGKPPTSDKSISSLHDTEPLVYDQRNDPLEPQIEQGLTLSINLRSSTKEQIIGYVAKNTTAVIDLAKVDYYEPSEFWDRLLGPASGELIIEPDRFYIFASRELVRIPTRYAAEMIPYDPIIGEFRAHYAGFFDPGFGIGNKSNRGTRAVLEIKAYYVPMVMQSSQIVAKLIFERMMAPPKKVYGKEIRSSYNDQQIALAKQFL